MGATEAYKGGVRVLADLPGCVVLMVLYLTSLGNDACRVASALSSLIRDFSSREGAPCPPEGPATSPAMHDSA